MRASTLKGVVATEARAIPKKVPKRPSEPRTATAAAPRRSRERSTAGTGCSLIKAVAIDPQRPEWEILGVQVILQHEDAREAGAVPEVVLPGTVVTLGGDEVLDAPLECRPLPAGGQQRQQRPRRLRRNGLAPSGQLGAVVALAGLAPAAVPVLTAFQPPDGALHVFLAGVLADGAETAQHRPGPVDVVDAPASEPGAVVPLPRLQEVQRAGRRLEVAPVAVRAEQLEATSGEVFGGGIQQRA